MKLVIDTNIIISALIRESLTRRMLIFPGVKLFTPEVTLKEIDKHIDLIINKIKLSRNDINQILAIFNKNIKLVPESKWIKYYKKADSMIGKKDVKDIPFIAVTLSISADGIWSNDSDFETQSDFKIWKTTELAEELGFIERKK